MTLFPLEREEKITALWDMDLSGVGENSPLNLFALLISILSNTFPQCPGLLEILFKGFAIISPEILTDPIEIAFENLDIFEEIVLVQQTYIAPHFRGLDAILVVSLKPFPQKSRYELSRSATVLTISYAMRWGK